MKLQLGEVCQGDALFLGRCVRAMCYSWGGVSGAMCHSCTILPVLMLAVVRSKPCARRGGGLQEIEENLRLMRHSLFIPDEDC